MQPAQRVDVPDTGPRDTGPRDSNDLGDRSIVAYKRIFNRPTGLQPNTKIWLSIDSYAGNSICVLLNDTKIHQTELADPVRIEITPYMKLSNQLVIQLHGANACLDGAVTLEIQ